jgi:hypothetical protein
MNRAWKNPRRKKVSTKVTLRELDRLPESSTFDSVSMGRAERSVPVRLPEEILGVLCRGDRELSALWLC